MACVASSVRCALLGAALMAAALPGHAADVAGSKDHPLVGRFSGAQINAYKQLDYDEALAPDQAIPKESEAKALALEGKVTRIGYRIDGGKSALEVYRNYQDTLQAGGFKTVFECKGDEQCGGDFQSYVFNSGKVSPLGHGDAVFGGKYYAMLARKQAPSGDVYAFLDVMQDEANKRTPVFLQVVELKAMQTGQVELPDATAMQKALTESGRVAVYGVYFDTDKAEVKADSKAALDEMGKLLQANPALKVYIVGHTDNQGSLARNMDLSQKRADAVAKALAESYRIPAGRLSARGVASLAPVASNDAEEGRARNRRVELVKQ
ncbi:cell envelope biogenesis protein OmpA [Achromobacter pulmonis]|uniref:Cell envelope biogenesis protein OmpA n=1 Tax=Achromobacter pulmonis TaxID=1389932 RepID=A0A2N8KF13_9BURK|nr:OmpA family protein [Achromobacter pulmonis]PND32042.1 cell envelope biogenesis protein OmpA [Achromobacter pulmonis]